jgi:lipoprotein-anchoring transpeptidase ErfK/SrfK
MLRTFAVACALAAACPLAPAREPSRQAPEWDLEAALAAAAADPAQVVPLVLDVSARVTRVDGATGQRYADALAPLLERVFFSSERFPSEERLGLVEHTVASGELPGAIARRYRIGAGLLAMLNEGYDERRIAAGRKLRVLDLSNGSLQVFVDKGRFRVSAWHRAPGGELVLTMYARAGLGAAASPTPQGTTRIAERVRDPPWTIPGTRETVPHGDPRNVLGGYWIELDPSGIATDGIGFHGFTGAPPSEWLERNGSNGCIRLLQADIGRLFELALEGTPVVVVP